MSTKPNLAASAWKLMFDFLIATSPDRERSLESRGLTPNDARALWSLDQDRGTPIGSLAKQWSCDPANATFIIGRLERARLASRMVSSDDRRVKLVQLTTLGAQTKKDLLAEYLVPPPDLLALTEDELKLLVGLLTRIKRQT